MFPLECGKVEEAARSPKLNLLPGLGGSGGGRSSVELVLVLPVFCRLPRLVPLPEKMRCSYFCLMNLSKAPSTSSTSTGMDGFTFWGLYFRFDAALPVLFIF